MNITDDVRVMLSKMKVLLDGTCFRKSKEWNESSFAIYESKQLVLTSSKVYPTKSDTFSLENQMLMN
jgi:hypothetical protein